LNFPRVVLTGTIFLFGLIGLAGIVKKATFVGRNGCSKSHYPSEKIQDEKGDGLTPLVAIEGKFPRIDRVHELFAKHSSLPIVKTITYKSNVSWLKGRPAWISDYAARYKTSSHFIARSLAGKAQYDAPAVFEGDQFTLYEEKVQIHFFLVVDRSLCQMGLYYLDKIHGERVFLKAYPVSLGKKEKNGTPKGVFSLGSKVGIYKKGEMGYHLGRKVEMIQVFGTRWMPLKGASKIGIQGSPIIEGKEIVSQGYSTDGCIKMSKGDIEELFAIVSGRPTAVIITDDFSSARLPGREVAQL